MNPTIACLMPTFNRAPSLLPMLGQAVESFLRQDLPAGEAELLICNDTPGQRLHVGPQVAAQGVRVVNTGTRFPTLSAKLEWMIENTQADYLCRWDDDDINLPWRLSYSLAMLRDHGWSHWHPTNYWYNPVQWSDTYWESPQGRYIEDIGHGNTHVTALWHRSCLRAIGGYPTGHSGTEDQAFDQAIRGAGLLRETTLPPADIFYLYRWGVTPNHLSGVSVPHGLTSRQGLQLHWDKLGRAKAAPGDYEIVPSWPVDFAALVDTKGEPLAASQQ